MDVIRTVTEWRRTPCVDGIVLHAAGHSTRIRIRPRLRHHVPLRQLATAVATECIEGIERIEHGELVQVVTAEGELAGLASAMIHGRGHDLECIVAVAGDDPHLCIDAVGNARGDANLCAIVAALVRELGTGLGRERRRWFVYDSPRGWFGIRRQEQTIWLHPHYPRVAARATVHDARPFRDLAAERFDRALFMRMPIGFTANEPVELADLAGDHGLEGRLRILVGTRPTGERMLRAAAAFADDQFGYYADFEAPDDAIQIETFKRLVASFRSLPRAATTDQFTSMWAD